MIRALSFRMVKTAFHATIIFAALSVLSVSQVRAGLLHSAVQILGQGGPDATGMAVYYNTFMTGESGMVVSDFGEDTGVYGTATSSFASVQPYANNLIRLTTESHSNTAGGFVPPANSFAGGQWRDVVYLSGGNIPNSIRLHFTVDGSFSNSILDPVDLPYAGSSSLLQIYFDSFSNFGVPQYPGLISGTGQYSAANYSYYEGKVNETFETGFATLVGGADGFSATFSYDVPYDPSLGGYTWSLLAGIRAVTNHGDASADFGHTIKLDYVTLTDGTPISTSDLSFDSGLQLSVNAVPEPSSFLLFALGAIGGCVIVKRMRRPKEPLVVS